MPERAQQIRKQAREREADEHERDRQALAGLADAARRREQARPDHADDDREHRQTLGSSGVLAEHPLAEEQQHEQPRRERRLHDDQRRQQQRENLQRPAENRQARAEHPAGAPEQPPHERHPQVLLPRRLSRIQCLQGDP
jgi:hypothetical protein